LYCIFSDLLGDGIFVVDDNESGDGNIPENKFVFGSGEVVGLVAETGADATSTA
jgi:hypothetical protein